jgi:hypothetical protein
MASTVPAKLDRPRKRGRPKKKPGAPVDHRLKPPMQKAIALWVGENLSRADAARQAGVTEAGLRRTMKENPAARAHYTAELKTLIGGSRHIGVHCLLNTIRESANAAARVAASRCLLELDTESRALIERAPPATAGITIVFNQAPGPVNITPVPPFIEHEPAGVHAWPSTD